jgi:hypothetical protein
MKTSKQQSGQSGRTVDMTPFEHWGPDAPVGDPPFFEPPAPSPPWWTDPAKIPPRVHRIGKRWIEAPNPYLWREVTPTQIEGQWTGGEFERYMPDTGFYPWIGMFQNTTGEWSPFRRVRPDEEQQALDQMAPPIARRLREQLGIAEPPRTLPGDLFEAGLLWVNSYLGRLNLTSYEEYLIRHVQGDWGLIGKADETTVSALDPVCPAVAIVAVRNMLALEAGHGVVESVFEVPKTERGPVFYFFKTLLHPSGNRTGVTYRQR